MGPTSKGRREEGTGEGKGRGRGEEGREWKGRGGGKGPPGKILATGLKKKAEWFIGHEYRMLLWN